MATEKVNMKKLFNKLLIVYKKTRHYQWATDTNRMF